MRRPPSGKGKSAPPELAGGRAWQRVQQFNLARGLPTSPTPTGTALPSSSPHKAAVKAATKTRTSAKTRSAATKSRATAKRPTRSRQK